jgi:uncharacterized protein (TIGR03435 family)
MKKLMLGVAMCLALLFASLKAQETDRIVGTWQGTLKVQKDLRLIMVLSRDDGKLKATMYSIDQGAQPLKASSASLEGGILKVSVDFIGATYEGKVGPDGNTITGTFTQGPTPTPLIFARATKETAWEIPAPPPPPKLMAADADPSFDAATIKPNDTGATSMQRLTIQGRKFQTIASSLEDLICFAYQVQGKQIVNAPAWLSTDRYDLEAVPDTDGAPSADQLRSMIRKLLADRWQLKFHNEKREMSAFVVSPGKGGAKLTATQVTGPLPGIGLAPAKGGVSIMIRNGTMGDFTDFLQSAVLDRPVVDHTELKGRYDLKVTFLPDDSQFNGHSPFAKPADGVELAPSLTEAMQQDLGLKLTAEKTAVAVLSIDRVEKPSGN